MRYNVIMNEAAVREFIEHIIAEQQTGKATEHSYRPIFKDHLFNYIDGITAVNEPQRSEHGAPHSR